MSHDAISNWVEKAKQIDASSEVSEGVKVIRRPQPQNLGNQIMEIAEKIRPALMKLLKNVRDENGMLVQPARARGIALNIAQRLVSEQANNTNA